MEKQELAKELGYQCSRIYWSLYRKGRAPVRKKILSVESLVTQHRPGVTFLEGARNLKAIGERGKCNENILTELDDLIMELEKDCIGGMRIAHKFHGQKDMTFQEKQEYMYFIAGLMMRVKPKKNTKIRKLNGAAIVVRNDHPGYPYALVTEGYEFLGNLKTIGEASSSYNEAKRDLDYVYPWYAQAWEIVKLEYRSAGKELEQREVQKYQCSRCCRCPHFQEINAICSNTYSGPSSICKFVKVFVDGKQRIYKVVSGKEGYAGHAFIKTSGRWVRITSLTWKPNFDEAQSELNKYAEKKNLQVRADR